MCFAFLWTLNRCPFPLPAALQAHCVWANQAMARKMGLGSVQAAVLASTQVCHAHCRCEMCQQLFVCTRLNSPCQQAAYPPCPALQAVTSNAGFNRLVWLTAETQMLLNSFLPYTDLAQVF